jgi:hypothetical protein
MGLNVTARQSYHPPYEAGQADVGHPACGSGGGSSGSCFDMSGDFYPYWLTDFSDVIPLNYPLRR